MFARTDIGERRILQDIYRKTPTVLRVVTPFVAVPLILGYIALVLLTYPTFWQWSNLGSLIFQIIYLVCFSITLVWVLARAWFFIRLFISLVYQGLCAFFAAANRVPPAYLEDKRPRVRQLLFHLVVLSPDILIRAGPRSPKQSPFTLFQRAAFLVAP